MVSQRNVTPTPLHSRLFLKPSLSFVGMEADNPLTLPVRAVLYGCCFSRMSSRGRLHPFFYCDFQPSSQKSRLTGLC